MNELNIRIMKEIGLEINDHNYIIDQDNGTELMMNGKYLISERGKTNVRDNSIIFDPKNNKKQMVNLFSYYTNKISEEDGVEISVFYPSINKDGSGSITLVDDNNDEIKSKNYYNDCLKYADLIFQLSGDTNVDLSEYDSIIRS